MLYLSLTGHSFCPMLSTMNCPGLGHRTVRPGPSAFPQQPNTIAPRDCGNFGSHPPLRRFLPVKKVLIANTDQDARGDLQAEQHCSELFCIVSATIPSPGAGDQSTELRNPAQRRGEIPRFPCGWFASTHLGLMTKTHPLCPVHAPSRIDLDKYVTVPSCLA